MKRRRAMLVLVSTLALAACEGDSKPAASAADRSSEEAGQAASGARAAAEEAHAVSEPAPASTSELYVEGFYRSEGARVIAVLPLELLDDDSVELERFKGGRRIVAKGKDGAFTVFLSILPPGSYDSEAATEAIRETVAESLRKNVNLDELPLRATKEVGAGGTVYSFRHGPAANGAIASLAVIVDGRDAAMILAMGSERSTDEVVTQMLAQLRVGSRVPGLADLEPSRRLEGVFASEPEAEGGALLSDWITFDPRGYAHTFAPRDEAAHDMAAMVQSAAMGQWRTFTYEVRDGVLELTPLRAGDSARSWKLGGSGRAITLDSLRYSRVDGLIPDGFTFEGVWEFYTGASIGTVGGDYMSSSTTKRFTFGPGDRVSFTGGTMVLGNTRDAGGLVDSRSSGYVDNGTWSGSYRVKDETLIIKTADGLTITRPLAAVLFGGKMSKTSVTIAGRIYNQET